MPLLHIDPSVLPPGEIRKLGPAGGGDEIVKHSVGCFSNGCDANSFGGLRTKQPGVTCSDGVCWSFSKR
jgi:hypothetical protein